jgi:hypothetical protein
LGSNTPVFPWLYRHIPTFSMFQAPARWMIWAEFALALLAGFGADRWRRPQAWGLYLTRLGTMGAVAVSIGTGLTWLCLGGVSPSFIKSAAIIGALGVGAGLLSLSAPLDATVRQKSENEYPCENSSKRNRLIQLKPPKSGIPLPGKYYSQTRWQWAVVIWIMVDLLAAGWGLNPGVDLNIYGPTPGTDQMKSMLAGKRLYLNSVQEDWLKYVRFMRFNTFEIGEDWLNLRRVFLPDTNLLDEIPSTSNYDPLVPGRFAEWKELLLEVSPETYLDLLRLMGVGAVESLDRRIQSGVSFAPLDGERVRIVNCAIPAKDGAEAEELMSGGQIDFDRQVVVENLLASVNTCNQKSVEGIVNEVIIIKAWDDGPNIKHFETKSNGSGWLVISDTWYPGWRSWIDGQPVPLYRANFLFMALELPEGDHKIEIKYQPLSLYLGAGISLISLLLFGFVLKWKRRRLSG